MAVNRKKNPVTATPQQGNGAVVAKPGRKGFGEAQTEADRLSRVEAISREKDDFRDLRRGLGELRDLVVAIGPSTDNTKNTTVILVLQDAIMRKFGELEHSLKGWEEFLSG